MSDPRLEAIREAHSHATNYPQDNVVYLLAMIDTLQRTNERYRDIIIADGLPPDALEPEQFGLRLRQIEELQAKCDTLQRERDEVRSELDAIAAVVSDRGEAGMYAKVEAVQRERDEDARWLHDAGKAYAPCFEHQPHMWEGDGTCVICEGQRLKDRADYAEAQVSRLTEALRKLLAVDAATGTVEERAAIEAAQKLLASPNQEPQP